MPGQLTNEEIMELVNGIRGGVGDLIKKGAIKKHGGKVPMNFKIDVEIDEENSPFVKSETDTSAALGRCYKICVSYGGSTRCYTIC